MKEKTLKDETVLRERLNVCFKRQQAKRLFGTTSRQGPSSPNNGVFAEFVYERASQSGTDMDGCMDVVVSGL